MVFVSAKERRGVTKVLDRAAKLVEQYRARFPTPQLNELLEASRRSTRRRSRRATR